MRRLLLLTLGLLLTLAPAAHAGGWATVGLSSLPSGERWVVDITVLQHGRTPLVGVEPTVTIEQGERRQTFAAAPTARDGVYRATVTFPSGGRWTYAVDDGFGRTHTFAPARIGAAATANPAAAAGGGPDLALLTAGIALLLAAAAVLVLATRGPRPRVA